MSIIEKLPNQKFILDDNSSINLAQDCVNKKVVLYFYPKDNTPGCTIEALNFEHLHKEFMQHNTMVIGVSKDNVNKHQKFKNKYNLSFPLIADETAELCQAFGVYQEKSMFGKKYMGIIRSTFVFNQQGILVKSWPKVKIKNHAEEVLAFTQSI